MGLTCVVIESPLKGDIARNQRYARACMLDSLKRGEAPFASHLLYTQCLDDTVAAERAMGMAAGFAWGKMAELCAVYVDLGISGGMTEGIKVAYAAGIPREYRWLRGEWTV